MASFAHNSLLSIAQNRSMTMRTAYLQTLPHVLLRYRAWFIALFQALLVLFSVIFAWMLRFEFTLPNRLLLFSAAPILVLLRLAAITHFGLLRGWWRYASVKDGIDIVKAVVVGSALFWIFMHAFQIPSFPRSIYVLEALLTTVLLGGVRLLSRVLGQSAKIDAASRKKVLIIGAGSAAQTIIYEMSQTNSEFVAVGCVDDDLSKQGIRIRGVPVLGMVDELPRLAAQLLIDEVLIAVPSATGSQMRRFTEICGKAAIKFRTMPALRDIIAGQIRVNQLRDVSLEDLLGRKRVQIDLESVRKQISGRVVAVTGAAGSIGSELCRQILEYGPRQLLCLDQNESGLFHLQHDLVSHKNGTEVTMCVADITDAERIGKLFYERRPQILFHAAAYKHVPLMEENVHEAVKNNVFGLVSLLDIADDCGCESFVLISSDKAVNPSSVMGVTKRIGEMILSSRPTNGMRCVSVRFGNVLGSNGSVVPLLQQQLAQHRPLTVTHPEMKRFFMVIPEAVALVLQAFAIGTHGDILVLDMGEPIRILDLARTLARLTGKLEDAVEIEFTGLRPGEKLEEQLFYSSETVYPTTYEKIKRTHAELLGWSDLENHLRELREAISINGAGFIRAKIKEIVPEYCDTTTQWVPSDNDLLVTVIEEKKADSLPRGAATGSLVWSNNSNA